MLWHFRVRLTNCQGKNFKCSIFFSHKISEHQKLNYSAKPLPQPLHMQGMIVETVTHTMICKHRGFIIVFCIGLIIMGCSICPLETDLLFKVIAISYLIGSACLFVRIFGIAPKCQLCIPIIEVGGQNPPWNGSPAPAG